MLQNTLTPIGLEDPAAAMEAFQEAGNEVLVKLREVITSPEKKKTLRTWGIYDAAKMVGITAPTLRKFEVEGGKLGAATKDEKNHRVYSLHRINQIRNILKTRPVRPEGSQPMVISVSNFKGGSAKTTTTIHLAQKCALLGFKVLLLDFDPQGSSTFVSTGLVPDLELAYEDTIYETLIENPSHIENVIRKTHFDGLDIIPGNLALQDIELALPNPKVNSSDRLGSPATRLQQALSHIKHQYDIIIVDCGPNLGVLTINAIIAANGLLIPIPPNMFDYASFIMLTGTLKRLFTSLKNSGQSKSFDFFRILLSKHSGTNEALQVENMIRKQYSGFVMANHMCATVEIEKATNDIGSVYEISKPRGSKEAYRRAMHHLEAVNSEIINYFNQVWKNQSLQSFQLSSQQGVAHV